ncbi:MAG TPA: hypothetical protein VIM97_00640, partial [Actinomycetes bacterium]
MPGRSAVTAVRCLRALARPHRGPAVPAWASVRARPAPAVPAWAGPALPASLACAVASPVRAVPAVPAAVAAVREATAAVP